MTQKNIHKVFIPPKIFMKTPKNIETQNFEPPPPPKKMSRAYVCMKTIEYPLPLPLGVSAPQA